MYGSALVKSVNALVLYIYSIPIIAAFAMKLCKIQIGILSTITETPYE